MDKALRRFGILFTCQGILLVFLFLAMFSAAGCKKSGSSTPDNTSMREGLLVTGPSQTDCSGSVVLEAVNTLCELFGAGSCVDQKSSCNSYARQIFSGTFNDENGSSWNGRGGSGQQMADATLCTLRELSPKAQGGGPLVSSAGINIGIGTVTVRQEVGYLDFDRVNAVFKGYRKMYVEIPVLGKFDAVAQDFELRKTEFGGHHFNPFPFAGGYQIISGYGLDMITEEKSKSITVKPPSFEVTTPIGVFTAQPSFEYLSTTGVADTPFASDHTYVLLPPDAYGDVALKLEDLYGILPGVKNTETPKPSVIAYQERRGGWISQIGLGNRGTGTKNDPVWSPPSSGTFSRPDYDPTGLLDFLAYQPRSTEEKRPSVYAMASASLKYPEDPYALLPKWVPKLPGVSTIAYIQITPTIEAGGAGQFGVVLSEGTNYERFGEFDLRSSRLSSLGIYSGVKTNASFFVDTLLRIKVSASYDTPFGSLDVTLIDIDPHFPIPLAGGTPTASPVKFASAYSSSDSTPDFLETLDSLKTFVSLKADPKAFIALCYAKENEVPPETPPTPTSEKGKPEDLFANEIWPCNICMATNEVVDQGGNLKEPAHSEFLLPAKTLPTAWKCDSKAKSGCRDQCSWDKTFDANGKPNLKVVAGPLDIANSLPDTDPNKGFLQSCMTPCGSFAGTVPGPTCIADSTPPQIVVVNTNGVNPFPVNGVITATFSDQMDPTTINAGTFTVAVATRTGTPVTGTVSYDSITYTATFSPTSLDYSTTYVATITTGVQNASHQALATAVTSTFTTAAR